METFVPLYISSHCDSYCKMCNFNHDNQSLQRIQATENEIVEQLKIRVSINLFYFVRLCSSSCLYFNGRSIWGREKN